MICISLIAYVVLSLNIVFAPYVLESRGRIADISLVTTAAQQIRGVIPENTYGIGYGISPIWHELGWDNY